MDTEQTSGAARPLQPASERFFTVESANDALVLVRKIVADVVDAYNELLRLRAERQELALAPEGYANLEAVRRQIEDHAARLKHLNQELIDIGCELKDLARGLVDFPAFLENRRVWLCWKLGDPEIGYWHELEAGFAGRRPIDDGFRLALTETPPVEIAEAEPL